MIDIHIHILPGVDDGASDWDTSLSMARMAVESGVTAVVATPHCNMRYRNFQRSRLVQRMGRFRNMLRQFQIPLDLYDGMEIMGSYDTGERLKEGTLTTLNGSRYPLVEFHFTGSGQEETDILNSILQCGYRPIVAHPERYLYVQEDPELLNTWLEMGCLLQINRGSLLGRFGQRASVVAHAMVDRGFAAVVASDAHSHVQRTPWMADVWEMLASDFSPSTARRLLEEHPRRILLDQEIHMESPDWF